MSEKLSGHAVFDLKNNTVKGNGEIIKNTESGAELALILSKKKNLKDAFKNVFAKSNNAKKKKKKRKEKTTTHSVKFPVQKGVNEYTIVIERQASFGDYLEKLKSLLPKKPKTPDTSLNLFSKKSYQYDQISSFVSDNKLQIPLDKQKDVLKRHKKILALLEKRNKFQVHDGDHRITDSSGFVGDKSLNLWALQLLNISKSRSLTHAELHTYAPFWQKKAKVSTTKDQQAVYHSMENAMLRLEKMGLVRVSEGSYSLVLDAKLKDTVPSALVEEEQIHSSDDELKKYRNHKQLAEDRIKEIARILKKTPNDRASQKRKKAAEKTLQKANAMIDLLTQD